MLVCPIFQTVLVSFSSDANVLYERIQRKSICWVITVATPPRNKKEKGVGLWAIWGVVGRRGVVALPTT